MKRWRLLICKGIVSVYVHTQRHILVYRACNSMLNNTEQIPFSKPPAHAVTALQMLICFFCFICGMVVVLSCPDTGISDFPLGYLSTLYSSKLLLFGRELLMCVTHIIVMYIHNGHYVKSNGKVLKNHFESIQAGLSTEPNIRKKACRQSVSERLGFISGRRFISNICDLIRPYHIKMSSPPRLQSSQTAKINCSSLHRAVAPV